MGRKKEEKKVTDIHDITKETWIKLGQDLSDRVHDMEIDADQLDEEQGPDYMPAYRGLAAWALKGGLAAEPKPKEKKS